MKILIGYDGSQSSDYALTSLATAGLPKKAQVQVLKVVPPLLPLEFLASTGEGMAWYGNAYKEAVASEKFAIASALDKVKEAVKILKQKFPGWTITAKTAVDDPAHGILSLAEKWKPNLIVIGSLGWNTFTELLLGSVAERVLNHAQCAVRIGRMREKEKGKALIKEPVRPLRLLIGFDGSKFADAALDQVVLRTWPKGTKALLVAVSDFQLRMNDISLALNKVAVNNGKPPGHGQGGPGSWIEEKMANGALKLKAAGIKPETALMSGDPRQVLLTQAKDLDIDTIFLGSRGTSTLQRFFLGSVSSAIAAHANCSVEIVHLRAKGKKK
jgi:nucleotide-binding universal stress UspA family protein